ncbi:MAG: FliH/SctL family protein [Pirellulales bacterium]
MATILRSLTAAVDARKTRESLTDAAKMAEAAQRCLEQAQAEAARLMEDARRDAEQIRAEAYEVGRREGRAEVELEVRAELGRQWADAPRTLDRLLDEWSRTQREWVARWEQDAVRLACAMASRIVRRTAVAEPEIALGLIRESLEMASGRRRIRLQLHPDDLALLADGIRQVLVARGIQSEVELQADSALERGSCRVLTEHGEIDQRWSTQLARVAEELDL